MKHGILAAVFAVLWMVSPSRGERVIELLDVGNIAAWETRRETARLSKEFASSAVSVANDGRPALLWSFTPRSARYNDLWHAREINDRFARLRFGIENRGTTLDFAVKILDAGGAEWTVRPIALASGGGRREIVFSLADFKLAGWSKDSDGRLNFPVGQVVLIAFGLRAGEAYSLAVHSATLEFDAAPQLDVTSIDIPVDVAAGSKFRASFTASLLRGFFRDDEATLELRALGKRRIGLDLKADASLASWKPGEKRSFATGDAIIGRFVRGGAFDAVVRIDGTDVELISKGALLKPRVTIAARKPGGVVAEIKPRLGVPTLFIDGKPRPWLSYAAYNPSARVFADFEKAGVSIFSVMATATDHGYSLARTAWLSPEEFDFSQLDERMEMVLEGDANAVVIPRVYLAAPKWWCSQHPDDLVTHDTGDGKPTPFIQNGKPVPSWASEPWRRDTASALRRLIAHVEASPYADRIIGYHIASGTTEEWMQWGSNDRLWVDYSPANLKKFRAWLEAKYLTDAGLQKAWRNRAVTLETAMIPSKKDRQSCRPGTMRDPELEQASIDYALYTSDLVAETIRYFCAIVKEATNRTKLAGAFYGYVLQLAGEARQQNAGHLALRQVWDCRDLDFLACPTSYFFRALGSGTTHMMSLLDGALRAGKMWIDENDIRTSLSPGKLGAWGKPADVAGDILQQERELAHVLVRGFGTWWFDVGRNRYDDPALMKSIAGLGRSGASLIDADRSPTDEIAFVVDSRALSLMEVGNTLSRHLIMMQIPEAHRIGAPIGWYDISDLDTLPPRRMYVFLNLFDPTAKDLENIARLKSDGRVLIFIYGAGVYNRGLFSPKASERLIGFPLMHRAQEGPLSVKVGEGAFLHIAALEYAKDVRTRGYFVPGQTVGKVLGTLTDGAPGLVLNEHEGCTVIWSAGPTLPARLLRAAAAKAGVHHYIDTDDVVWATRETLAITVNEPGRRTIRLPRPARIIDVFSGAVVVEDASSFDADFQAGGTRLYRLEVR